MNITILCSDSAHPVNLYLNSWAKEVEDFYNVSIVRTKDELTFGDFLFLVSCSELINFEHREHYRHVLVLHASDLPKGRGWSPHIWEIIQGGEKITLTLLEAEDKVDTGRIWLKRVIDVENTALWDDVNKLLFDSEVQLINEALARYDEIRPYEQPIDESTTYHRKRTPNDSKLEPEFSISEQFDLIRMCDPDRYPAWFEFRGQKYKLLLEKIDNE